MVTIIFCGRKHHLLIGTIVDVYANNLNVAITDLASECIPNRVIRIKPSDPPWITSTLKKFIRKCKRAYRKAKKTNLESNWKKFRKLRNRTITMVRDSKQSFYDKIADKLKCETLSSKDWWSTLKTVIAPNSKSTIPPLTYNDNIYSDERDKANILNDYFQSQTLLDDQNAVLPELTPSVTYTTDTTKHGNK